MPLRPQTIFLCDIGRQKLDLFLIIITHRVELKPLELVLGANPGFSGCSQLWALPGFYKMTIASAVTLSRPYHMQSTSLGAS